MCGRKGKGEANLADWCKGLLEEIIVELLKAGPGEGLRQIHALCQTLDLHAHLLDQGVVSVDGPFSLVVGGKFKSYVHDKTAPKQSDTHTMPHVQADTRYQEAERAQL